MNTRVILLFLVVVCAFTSVHAINVQTLKALFGGVVGECRINKELCAEVIARNESVFYATHDACRETDEACNAFFGMHDELALADESDTFGIELIFCKYIGVFVKLYPRSLFEELMHEVCDVHIEFTDDMMIIY